MLVRAVVYSCVCYSCCVAIITLLLNLVVGTLHSQRGWGHATVGKLGEFVPKCKSLTAYVEWNELYFKANKI